VEPGVERVEPGVKRVWPVVEPGAEPEPSSSLSPRAGGGPGAGEAALEPWLAGYQHGLWSRSSNDAFTRRFSCAKECPEGEFDVAEASAWVDGYRRGVYEPRGLREPGLDAVPDQARALWAALGARRRERLAASAGNCRSDRLAHVQLVMAYELETARATQVSAAAERDELQ